MGAECVRASKRLFRLGHRYKSFALGLLAGELLGSPDGLGLLPDASLGRLFIRSPLFISRKIPSRCIFFFSTLKA
jgi:hypothetical protein